MIDDTPRRISEKHEIWKIELMNRRSTVEEGKIPKNTRFSDLFDGGSKV